MSVSLKGGTAMTKVSGIYAIENLVNHKVYIGQSVRVSQRWSWHMEKLNKNKHSNEHLQKAWNKYGCDKFAFILLEECEPDKLNEREQFWSYAFSKITKLYNIRATGEQTPMTKEHRERIGNALRGKYTGAKASMFGKKHTEEWHKEMSERHKGENAYWYGKHRSPETKEKLRQANLGKRQSDETRLKHSKPVLQFDLEGNLIREWISGTEAERVLGCHSSAVSQSCRKGFMVMKKYRFKFKEEVNNA